MATLAPTPGLPFQLSEKDLRFYEQIGVPPPTDPPDKIMQSIMAFRNEWKLYRRKCDFTSAGILSAYHDGVPFPVYKNEVWWGDDWNPLEYGRDFDFSRPFFEQFKELQNVVPREGTSVFRSENCEYNSHTRDSRNCYMNSLVYDAEDCHYSYWAVHVKDVVDCYMVNNSTLSYDCLDGDNLYECVGLQECYNCTSCHFSYQLLGCENCIGCWNLVRKQYHVANQPVSKEKFEEIKGQLLNGTRAGWEAGQRYFENAYSQAVHRAVHNLNCENALGDHLIGCKNCVMTFDSQNVEDCCYNISSADSKDIRHCYSAGWPGCEQIYCSAVTRGSTDVAYCYYTFYGNNLRYCDSTMNCHDCFGCIGTRRSKYCILNKQYTKEEYLALRDRIIDHMQNTGEWGKFFPMSCSSFAYNETAAQEYFPLKREEVEASGWRWHEQPEPYKLDGAAPHIPDSLAALPPDITKQIYQCGDGKRFFKFVKPELEFYRKMQIALPRYSPEARHRKRYRRRNPYQIFVRTCGSTGKNIYSSFDPERPEKVISEAAYHQEFLA